MFSRYIAAPFGLGLVIALTMTFLVSADYSWYIIPCFIALAIVYALHPQLDWWWANKHTPAMDSKLELWINKISPFYRQLNDLDKKKFQDRITLYLMANEYLLRGPEDFGSMPDDLKSLFAVPVVEMTFNQEEGWRLKKFERLILYPQPFPSPNFPTFIHSSEIEVEDGVIIAAISRLMDWVQAPERHFSLLHYEVAKAYMWTFREKINPSSIKFDWNELEAIGGFSEKELQEKIVGLPNIDPVAVLLSYYFTRGEKMKNVNSEMYEEVKNVFS